MLNNINSLYPDLPTLKVERIISDLKNSFIILLADDEQNLSMLTIAAEYFNLNHIKWLKEIGIEQISLVIPASRANYLFGTNSFEHQVDITFPIDQLDQILLLINSQDVLNTTSLYHINSHKSKYHSALQLMKIAELLPAAIVIDVNNINKNIIEQLTKDNVINKVNVADIKCYIKQHAILLQKICTAPLKLKYTEEAKIIAFRATTGGKEQYALIIGNLSDTDTPTVRIHSSCYTGDLLTSLMCDCGDQLAEAIKYMSCDKHHAGIIIYLMQEGRGIGFINKLRTYALQNKGFDTVEANEAWGFEDDERLFIYACQILKSLDIKKVKLLSNNPRKALSLTTEGIEVTEVLPHKTAVNQYNNFYLKTKAEKLGHEL